jgi:AraC-like DNA-binding protein
MTPQHAQQSTMRQGPEQRHREMLASVENGLEQSTPGSALAQKAYLSRFHYQRVFRRVVGEPPSRLRRRLLLERAAYELRATQMGITTIAFEANYKSLEGFSRAFKTAYGLSPTAYRQATTQIRLLPGFSGVHYNPATQRAISTLPGGKKNMNLVNRLLENDYLSKRRILECARFLSDAQLDAPLALRHNLRPFVEPDRTLRESLTSILGGGWVDQMYEAIGWKPQDTSYRDMTGNSVEEMIRFFERTHRAFREFIAHVEAENLWDQEWVDDACEPPETFAIGSVIEATLTWDIASRSMLERQMEQMGFQLHEMQIAESK